MSDKFFFKGKKEKKPKHSSYGFNTKRAVKIGTEELPLQVVVNTDARAEAVQTLAEEHNLVIAITVDAEQAENTTELDVLINKPVTTRFEKMPARNEPCVCGSGKKYKKCCG
ncbi:MULTISPECIES: PBPRA1643 family SWIM/SEC-C metal-binding motif protein [Psychromonas]|uniref:PBPRA1643 family SWIM/SEC-C metal-binding motif protein n=1 Tax=Psychromonas TaxID=67572 RepID=UPI000416688A|nr:MULTISPECIES: PBPRA1643 family SWIM/SEC-C metal-binding motif protein [Psychromonas]MBB1271925.1 SEC-C domain-containing protein [Psychromonas sp. SR45-3]